MVKNTADDLGTLLQPLVAATRPGCRVVARPGWVSLDRVGGPARLEVSWDESQHERALRAAALPLRFANGTTVMALGDHLVLQCAPDPLRRPEDLVAEGWLSPLAGRLLGQAVDLGRNVLLIGPPLVCAELAAAILAEGGRPAMIGLPGQAAPPGWPLFADAAAARAYGADRVGAWSLPAPMLTQVMSELCGVIGWIDARRLDQGLVRFELVGDRAGGGGPLRVLAAIDLVVVLTNEPSPRVQEVTEIILYDEGYRPLTLFATGRAPVPTALVPIAVPSFLADFDNAGHGVLADELRHAVGATPTYVPTLASVAANREIASAPIDAPEPVVSHAFAGGQPFGAPRPPAPDPRLDDAPPPGWELDQLGDEAIAAEVAAISDPDAALMAASYGLGPPPRPASVPGGSGGPFDGTFADALAQARKRDAKLRAELDQADGIPDTGDRLDPVADPEIDS